jgi:hypothetical protein
MEERGVSKLVSVKFVDSDGRMAKVKPAKPMDEASADAGELESVET